MNVPTLPGATVIHIAVRRLVSNDRGLTLWMPLCGKGHGPIDTPEPERAEPTCGSCLRIAEADPTGYDAVKHGETV